MAYLPDEILNMVCSQLWQQRDFDTLFNCACTGKQLATMAVRHLCRMQYVSYVGCREMRMSPNQVLVKKIDLWRTIILSSLGKTLYPYSQYIRILELDSLGNLLRWMESIDDFFQGELAHFRVDKQAVLHTAETINGIGEAITKQTPLLEVLAGDVCSGAMSRWISQLPRLKRLELLYEPTFKGIGNLIRLHCPSFNELQLWHWYSSIFTQPSPMSNITDTISDSNQNLAAFLNELHPQSLQLFEILGDHSLGPEVFQALSCHGESLIELNVQGIPSITIPDIPLLKCCTNLVSLSLSAPALYIDEVEKVEKVEKPHNNAFSETLAWLKECNKLRNLCFLQYFSAPALMASVFLETNIRLTSLVYEGLVMRDVGLAQHPNRTSKQNLWLMRDTRKFHQALANQTSLQRLYLRGDVDEYGWEADILLESLSKLVNLTDLCLEEISNYFVDKHIVQLASSLPKLESWETNGQGLTDAIWGEVASLRSLKHLTIDASTCFTANGILGFIEALGPGNRGLNLFVEDVAFGSDLEEEEQKLIKAVIAKTVQGRFYEDNRSRNRK